MNTGALQEVVFTPRSDLMEPLKFFRGMIRDLITCRELAWRLFVRDFAARYRQSLLGYVWAFVPPIATTLTFVFLRNQGLFTTGKTEIPYPAYVVLGMLFWQLFVDALQCPLKAVTAARAVISKIQLPPEAILMAGLGEVIVSFLIRLALVVVVFSWYRLVPPPSTLLVPIAVVAMTVLGFTLGILVTPLGVLYTDVTQALSVVTSFWLFFTPVIYPVQNSGAAGLLSRWNPVSPVLIVGRDWLTMGSTTHLPDFVFVTVLSMLVLLLSWVSYRIALPHLIARIGN